MGGGWLIYIEVRVGDRGVYYLIFFFICAFVFYKSFCKIKTVKLSFQVTVKWQGS